MAARSPTFARARDSRARFRPSRSARDAYAAFVELHIEQGPILETRGLDIGVVTAIAAPASLRVHIEGVGGHAGAVLMPERRDAFLAGAEVALAVEAAARGTGSIDTVGTVGVCDVFPGAINSVPSRTTLGVDVRDIDGRRRDAALAAIRQACDDIAARRRVSIVIETINADAPCQCAPDCHRGDHRSGRRARAGRHVAHQPGVPRFALHVPRGADRHDFHPLPRRGESQAGRVRVAGSNCSGCCSAGRTLAALAA